MQTDKALASMILPLADVLRDVIAGKNFRAVLKTKDDQDSWHDSWDDRHGGTFTRVVGDMHRQDMRDIHVEYTDGISTRSVPLWDLAEAKLAGAYGTN